NIPFSYWLKYNFAAEYEKSIQAMVYAGAALLVIIVGLRGLGNISDVPFIPNFLLNHEGKIDSNFVMIGLLVEFTMLCLLAAVSFFSPRDSDKDLQSSINNLAETVDTLSETVPSEVGQTLMKSAQETKSAIESFLNKEMEILDKSKKQTEERLLQLNEDTVKIRQNISQGIVDSTNQVGIFFQNEKETINRYNSLIENLIADTKDSFQSITKSLKEGVKNTSVETKEVFEREKELINQFYKINSGLISKSGEEFREELKNYSSMIGSLVADARSAFQNVTNSLTEGVKNSTASSNRVFEREKEMIDKFYKINSELISRSGEEFRSVLKNYNNMMETESERLKWLSANQLRPAEYMQKSNNINDRLIIHLENIDNSLKIIMNEMNASGNRSLPRHTFYKRIKIRWKQLFNQTPS
ncbi:MAG: hypothetical protein GQ561_05080, partial [Calditrichae bacterium]|nr:hypothetical protein [Calditrichia bacterium]